jgi:endo-1,4-beta-xylanase
MGNTTWWYNIYLPPSYNTSTTTRYPVIYSLHGAGGDENGMTGYVNSYVDPYITQKKVPECIVVLPNGGPQAFYLDIGVVTNNQNINPDSYIIKELIPHIDSTYRTINDRKSRAISGMSMGGYGTWHFAFKYPQLFCAAGVFSAGGPYVNSVPMFSTYSPADDPHKLVVTNAAALSAGMRVYASVGALDFGLVPYNNSLSDSCKIYKIPYVFTVVPNVGHDLNGEMNTDGLDAVKYITNAFLGVPAYPSPDSLNPRYPRTISGIVTDTGGTPISGAVVQIEKGKQTATSGTDGRFTLGISSAIIPGKNNLSLQNTLSATIHNGLLWVNVVEKSAVVITTFDIAGKALSTVRRSMDAGTHGIALPYRGAGIYLYKVKSGARELVLKGNSVGKVSSGSAVSSQGPSSNPLAKQALFAAPTIDVIAVTKPGYLNYRMASAGNVDTSGIAIKMIASAGAVTDADGNVYQTVKIGNQEWMAENLRVTKYNDGTPIPLDTSGSGWRSASTPKYCYYNNTTNADTIKKFGAIYNGYVVSSSNSKKIAMSGWHVPTDAEWSTLQNYLTGSGYNWDGTKTNDKTAKSLAAKADWNRDSTTGVIGCDLTKNNRCGFSALPGGQRDLNGWFDGMGSFGYWWCATGSNYRYLFYCYGFLGGSGVGNTGGIAVRLLRG